MLGLGRIEFVGKFAYFHRQLILINRHSRRGSLFATNSFNCITMGVECCCKTVKSFSDRFCFWYFDDDLIMRRCLCGGLNTKFRTVVWKLDGNWRWSMITTFLLPRRRPPWLTTKCFHHIRTQSKALLACWQSQVCPGLEIYTSSVVSVTVARSRAFVKVVRNKYVPFISDISYRKTKCRHGQQLVPGLVADTGQHRGVITITIITHQQPE